MITKIIKYRKSTNHDAGLSVGTYALKSVDSGIILRF